MGAGIEERVWGDPVRTLREHVLACMSPRDMHTWRSVYVHVEHHVDTRVRAQVECDDGTFTVYTAGFETGRNASTRAGSTVAVCAHFRACVRLLLSHVLTCEPRKSNSGCMQRSIRRCGPQCRHASRSAPGSRYKRARRRSDRIHQAGGRLLIAGVLTRRL